MNWVKTYESFVYESVKDDVEKFEKIISFQKGTGIITAVDYDNMKKVLTVTLADKLGSFDLGGVMASVDKAKKKIKKEYGANQLDIGNTTINL